MTRGPYTICGYYRAPEINAAAFTPDGFYRMGDIVRKRGRDVYTTSLQGPHQPGWRKDQLRGGRNLIFQLPQVRQVSLVAMPDPVFGEKACAFVILHPGGLLTFDELIGHLRKQGIASFKLPERLELMSSFPECPVGKILKRELRNLIEQHLSSEERAP